MLGRRISLKVCIFAPSNVRVDEHIYTLSGCPAYPVEGER